MDSQVGDSGACATAIMAGVKSNFETVGVSGKIKLNDCAATIEPDAKVSTIVDWAQQFGKLIRNKINNGKIIGEKTYRIYR